jgi:hypothetical protein
METATTHISRRCRQLIASAVLVSALLGSAAAHTPAASALVKSERGRSLGAGADAPARVGKREHARRWLRRSHVPVPPVGFHLGGWDYGGTLGKTSSYRPDLRSIWWEGPLVDRQDREDLYHEGGHAFLDQWCTEGDLARIRHLAFRGSDKPWWWNEMPDPNPATGNEQPLEEDFADLFSQLAMTSAGWPGLRKTLAEIAARHQESN